MVPPHSIEAEQSVLGAVLIDRSALDEVIETLEPSDFYRQNHALIYAAMVALSERREPVDVLTVSETLSRNGDLVTVGGRAYLMELAAATPSAVHVAYYAGVVERTSICRNLISAAGKIAEVGYSGADAKDVIDRAEAILFGVASRRPGQGAGWRPLGELLHNAYTQITYLHDHRGELTGIPSGFLDLDLLTTGFQPSDLIICAARPGVGKTSFALNIAQHAGLVERRKVGVFSLEMSESQLVLRLLSGISGVDAKRLRSGEMGDDDFARVAPSMSALARASIYIDDASTLTATELRTKARRLAAKEGLDLLIVDYLQLMSASGRDGNRVQEVSDISRSLKALARELNIPVIALSQLNRAPEGRTEGNEPKLSDLRESGAIEQDADLVLFLWRERKAEESDLVQLNLAKHRNGPVGRLALRFNPNLTKFYPGAEA